LQLIKDVAKSNETEGRLLKGGKTKRLVESPEEGWSLQQLFSVQLRCGQCFSCTTLTVDLDLF
jgi:hypothetical protein